MFATDIVVVGIVLGPAAAALYAIPAKLFTMAFGLGSVGTSLLYPALAEHEGAGEEDRQRRLLLAGLRGGMAAAAFLALPMLLIPDLLIEGWVGDGYGESSPVLALLALVLLVHQPVYLMTQFLIARARQHEIARVLVLAGVANVVLSVTLAATVGLWGVALSTLVTDLAVLAYAAPWLVAPAASLSVGTLARSALRPLVPGVAAALLVFGGLARVTDPDTLVELVPLGIAWALVGGLALWRFGFDGAERATIGRQLRPPSAPVPEGL